MLSKRNLYNSFYHYTTESGDCIRDNTNYYIQLKYTKNQLIEQFKKFVLEDEELTDDFKEFIKTSNNINYRMVYGAYFEASCDIYWDKYDTDGFYTYYDGRHYYNTLKKTAYDPLLNIFKSHNGVLLGMDEPGIDIVSDYNIVNNLYANMVDKERDRWDDFGADQFEELNIKKIVVHVPMLIIGYIYEGQKYFSAIHAVTLQKYIAGKSKFDKPVLAKEDKKSITKNEKTIKQKPGYDLDGKRIFTIDNIWANIYLKQYKDGKGIKKFINLYESAMYGSLEAVKIFKKKIKNRYCAYYYAKFLEDSNSLSEEIISAYEFAVKRKSVYATSKLANMYKNGDIVARDLKKAKELYQKMSKYKSKEVSESLEIENAKDEFLKIDVENDVVYDYIGFVSPMTGLSIEKDKKSKR